MVRKSPEQIEAERMARELKRKQKELAARLFELDPLADSKPLVLPTTRLCQKQVVRTGLLGVGAASLGPCQLEEGHRADCRPAKRSEVTHGKHVSNPVHEPLCPGCEQGRLKLSIPKPPLLDRL